MSVTVFEVLSACFSKIFAYMKKMLYLCIRF